MTRSLRCIAFRALTALLLSAACLALDPPRRQVDLELSRNVAILQDNLDYFHIEAPASQRSANDEGDKEEANRAFQRLYSKAGGLLKQTSTFDGLKRAVRTRVGRRRYNKSVSANSTVLILNSTGSQFAALAVRARDAKAGTLRADASSIVNDMFGLLEDVSTVSASAAFEIANVIRGADRTTAGLLTTSTLSIFGFFEQVTLATTSLLVDYTGALNGQSANGTTLKLDALQVSLSTNTTNGVFGDVLIFLSQRGDKSGLIAVLNRLTLQLSSLRDRLVSFSATVDAELPLVTAGSEGKTAVVPAGDGALGGDALKDVSGLVAGINIVTVNSMQRVALGSLDIVGGIITSVVGLLMQRVDSILIQSMSTVNSVLGLLKADTKDSTASGDVIVYLLCTANCSSPVACLLLLLPWFIILSPILVPLAILRHIYYVLTCTPDPNLGCAIRADTKTSKRAKEALTYQTKTIPVPVLEEIFNVFPCN